jgi:hypothetical protein
LRLPARHPTVAKGIDADVDVGLIDHLQRSGDAGRVARRKLLHTDGEDARIKARLMRQRAVFRQVERRAADHGRELTGP